MPNKADILSAIPQDGEGISRTKLAEILNEPTYRSFQVQLDRFVKAGLIIDQGDHHYLITENGQKALSNIQEEVSETRRRFSFTISEDDLMILDEKDYETLWKILGRIVRARMNL